MKIGMAVNSGIGNSFARNELAADLAALIQKSDRLDLWVDGRPFSATLKAVSDQLVVAYGNEAPNDTQ